MANLTEAEGKAFFVKCKGIAILLAAVSGLVLGVLNWFKEVRDPRVKIGYQELSKQVESISGDLKKTTEIIKQQAEEISTIQNWIINERDRRGVQPTASIIKMQKQSKSQKKLAPTPMRKPEQWDVLQVQRGPRGG